MEFKIVEQGGKDDINTRASHRLVTAYEARRNVGKIMEVHEPQWTVRLRNGYLADSTIQTAYKMRIQLKLVTPAGSLESNSGTLTEEDLRIAMAYACENDDWQEVDKLVQLAGPRILAARLPHEHEGTVLHVCAYFDSCETLARLLTSEHIRPEVNNGGYDETPLHTAAEQGKLGAAKLILGIAESKKMLNAHNCYGNTPLHHSVNYGSLECLQLLLGTEGLRLDTPNNDGTTVLHRAAVKGNIQFVNEILMHPTATDLRLVDKRDHEGCTPLHCAASAGHHDICSRLLESGASPEIQDNGSKTPLDVAKSRQDYVSVLMDRLTSEMCLRFCASSIDLVNRKFESGSWPLHIAALTGSVELTQALIDGGAFLDVVNDDGETPLHIAVRRGDLEVFKCLLLLEKHKCCFSTATSSRQQWLSMPNLLDLDTALHTALKNHSIEMSLDLIKGRAFVDRKNRIGETPLHIAAREGDLKVFQTLLSSGTLSPGTDWSAWVRICDLDGETALHEAVRRGDEAVINELLRKQNGVNVNDKDVDDLLLMKDIDNRTALHYALQRPELLKNLLDCAAHDETRTFLMWNLASANSSEIPAEIQEMLKQLKNTDNNEMNDLLAKATKIRDLGMATELISKGADVTKLEMSARTWISDCLCEKASDRPARKDSLGRKPLVDGIAALLLSPFTATPITIGIFGAWGMGKSSVMSQVEEALLEIAVNENLRRSPSHFRSKVLKPFYRNKLDVESDERIEYQSEHHQLFKDLALTHPSTLVAKPGNRANATATLEEVGQIPAVVTVSYNAWRYLDKTEASAGLAIQISEELERSMSPPQWLRMCWSYSWESQSKDIFVQFILPLFLAIVALMVVVILWKVAPIKTAYKALSLPGLFGAALLLFRSWMGTLPSVTQKILSYIQTPDHRVILGYQHKVIHDINFLKEQLCKPPNTWWIILGYFTQWCTPNTSFCILGTGARKEAPPRDNLRIVVFIDDLDRCEQHIILELLSVINLILAECQINVVLGIDKNMVQRAIAKAFLNIQSDGSDANARYTAEDLADKYLQKIIQLPVQLPDLGSTELTTFLEGQIGHHSKSAHHWSTAPIIKEPNYSSSSWDPPAPSDPLSGGDIRDAGIYIVESPNNDAVQQPPPNFDHAIRISVVETAIPKPRAAPFRLILANYSQSEVDMLRGLCAQTQAGDNRFPREWKRFLNYHRLISNILLQEDHTMKSKKLKSWRRKLIIWIFICWNWTRQMNTIIETWDDLIFEAQRGWGGAKKETESETTPTDGKELMSLGDIVSRRLSTLDQCYLDDVQKQESNVGDTLSLGDVIEVQFKKLKTIPDTEKRKWRELRGLLKGENDLSLEFIEVFQRFRFYCELEHLKINPSCMVKKKRLKKKIE